jgi:hypothetical protein
MTEREAHSKTDIKKLSDQIEVLKEQARNKGLAFHALTTKELEKRLKSSHTPFIYTRSWSSRNSSTSSFYYSITVYNPDPNFYANLCAFFFFSPADMIVDIDTALLSADQRLYRGFKQFPYIASDSSSTVEFNYKFPTDLPLGLYIGNSFIFDRDNPGANSYKDRASIDVEIF